MKPIKGLVRHIHSLTAPQAPKTHLQERAQLEQEWCELRSLKIAYQQAPQARELSDDEIEGCVKWLGDPKDPYFNRIDFARAVLAARSEP